MSEVTLILKRAEQGDLEAAEALLPLVYDELRRLASARMAGERAGHTLQPTALVHEAWLRLGGDQQQPWQNRAHFFGAAAEAMRRILVDWARRRKAQRHGGGQEHLDIDELEIVSPAQSDDEMLGIHNVLDRFAAEEAEKAELVKLRYFAGMSIEEAASALGISAPTAKRWWRYARAWLRLEVGKEG